MKRATLLLAAFVWLMTGLTGISYGVSGYATTFKSTYPSSPLSALSTVSGQAGNLCTVCHGTSGGTRNAFGSAFASNGHSFPAIQNLDSDNDGFTNLAEITAGTFPGNAASRPSTPAACTDYTYSAWSGCGSNGQQTRTVTGNMPSGCTGTPSISPVLSQACTPPPTTTACTGYTYSAWSGCGSNGQQTRTVTGNMPSGCTGTPSTSPLLSQACTPPPTTTACTGYTYSAWSGCGSNGQQTRTVAGNTPSGCTGTPSTSPVLLQACTPSSTAVCTYNYSAWSACKNNKQTRRVISRSPSRCSGKPVLTQACNSTPAPAIDGTTLYMQRCSACHGSIERSQVRGEGASSIRDAIAQVGSMNHLRNLTTAQIQAIAKALATTTPAPSAPPVPAGGIHPNGWLNMHPDAVDRNGTSSCKTCHGQDLQGGIGPSCYSCHNGDGD